MLLLAGKVVCSMPYDLEDAEGWNALPTLSDSEEEMSSKSIGPLHCEESTYTYELQEIGQSLAITSQSQKVTVACSLVYPRSRSRGLHLAYFCTMKIIVGFRVSASRYGHLHCHCLDMHSCKICNREGTGRFYNWLQLVCCLLLAFPQLQPDYLGSVGETRDRAWCWLWTCWTGLCCPWGYCAAD